MDSKDKRIKELEALLKAALERIVVLEAEVAALNLAATNAGSSGCDVEDPKKRNVQY